MAEIVVEDVCQVTFDRALRGYRTQQVDAFLAQLVFARRAGLAAVELEGMLRDRQFSVVVGGYEREQVEALIESTAIGWRARDEATQLWDKADGLNQQLTRILHDLLSAIDDASRQLGAIHPSDARSVASPAATGRHRRVPTLQGHRPGGTTTTSPNPALMAKGETLPRVRWSGVVSPQAKDRAAVTVCRIHYMYRRPGAYRHHAATPLKSEPPVMTGASPVPSALIT
jgi:DivIVA domain-containing protein